MRKTLLTIPFLQQLKNRHGLYLSNLGATFISQAATALSILFITPVLVKNLGAESFGIYGVLLNVFVFASILDFGLNIGLLRRLIHQKEETTKLINAMFFFFLFVFVASVPIYYFLFRNGLLQSDNNFFFTSVFTGLIVVQNILAVFFDVMIQSVNKIFVGKVIRVVKTVVEFVALYFVSRTGSIAALLLTSTIVNTLYIAVLFLYSKKEVRYTISWRYFNLGVLLHHIRYCFWYFQNILATVLVYNAQIIMISSFVDPLSVTKLLLVMRFYDVIRTGIANFTGVLFPSLSAMQAEENWAHLRRTFFRVFTRVTVMVVVIFAFVLTVGEKVFLYWAKYNDQLTVDLFRIYSVFIALLLIEHVPLVFLSALKFNRLPSIVATVQGVAGLVLGYFLLPRYGILGATFGSLASFLCTNFLFNPIYLYRKLTYHSHAGGKL